MAIETYETVNGFVTVDPAQERARLLTMIAQWLCSEPKSSISQAKKMYKLTPVEVDEVVRQADAIFNGQVDRLIAGSK